MSPAKPARVRVFTARPAGLDPVRVGAYWRGARAEQIVAARVQQQLAAKQSRRKTSSAPRERSPHAQLRRLERNLGRRKTLAARQRIKQQIAQLKRDLGL